ncbi:hypothetical protein DPMN_106914 [Dreissena polymorpha]|uniref:Uncharacterized protein n=1 Tax=Dreissena polymorpha TaxID=45954 RepID=A0A9D4K5T0_DREPO|nr:hypothetical protein DPMN_106914 [Dreissena polymorpha]
MKKQKDRETGKQIYPCRQTKRQTDKRRYKKLRQTEKETDSNRPNDGQSDRSRDGQTERRKDRLI